MNFYYITGTSRGIGRAFAEYLLSQDNNYVVGIARGNGLHHARYQHRRVDLADLWDLGQINFSTTQEAKQVMLINNAAMLGHVEVVGNLPDGDIVRGVSVNLIAPLLLMNRFASAFNNFPGRKIIVNVSSGAAKKPIDSWATYCATKAGLEMATQVFAAEEKIKQRGFEVYSFTPGVVDTRMQAELRSVEEKQFSQVSRFREYHEQGQLQNPRKVAERFFNYFAKGAPTDIFLS